MRAADKVTSIRIILAPVFCIVYLFPAMVPGLGSLWTVPVLWALFIISEITDMIDGMVARSRGEVSDFGKLFDPFADTLVQLSYFLCFIVDGILPALLFLAVLYREFSILFLRNLMLRKGIAQGARISGKIKTVAYIAAGAVALLASTVRRLPWDSPAQSARIFSFLSLAATVIFIISVFLSIFSFIDYFKVYRAHQGLDKKFEKR
jgi:CDP-diacylglycerol--glycerol-3-phosphate 3-phosphatidyltransferase